MSSMKRVSHALQVRRLVDQILGTDPAARIVSGDCNAAPGEVAVLAIRGVIEETANPAGQIGSPERGSAR